MSGVRRGDLDAVGRLALDDVPAWAIAGVGVRRKRRALAIRTSGETFFSGTCEGSSLASAGDNHAELVADGAKICSTPTVSEAGASGEVTSGADGASAGAGAAVDAGGATVDAGETIVASDCVGAGGATMALDSASGGSAEANATVSARSSAASAAFNAAARSRSRNSRRVIGWSVGAVTSLPVGTGVASASVTGATGAAVATGATASTGTASEMRGIGVASCAANPSCARALSEESLATSSDSPSQEKIPTCYRTPSALSRGTLAQRHAATGILTTRAPQRWAYSLGDMANRVVQRAGVAPSSF